MASDRYIRIVLTVIAGCLIYLCVRDVAPPALAQAPQQPTPVVLVGVDRSRLPRWDDLGVRVNEPVRLDTNLPLKVKIEPYPPVEVKVANSPLNVHVTNANR
jgi:hypothetical protein